MWFLYLFFLCFLSYNNALFEDQIGKFDWYAKHIGCFEQTYFETTKSGEEILIAATNKNVIGRIDTNTGDLKWRQINEKNAHYSIKFIVKDSKVIAMLNNGEYFRSFDIDSGTLKWQIMLGINTNTQTLFDTNDKILVIVSDSNVYGFLGKNKIVSKWITNIDQECNWLKIIITDANQIFVVGVIKNKKTLRVLHIDYKSGGIIKVENTNFNDVTNFSACIFLKHNVLCSTNKYLISINLDNELKQTKLQMNSIITGLIDFVYSDSHFIIQTNNHYFLGKILNDGHVEIILNLNKSNHFSITKKNEFSLDDSMNNEKNFQFLFSSFDESRQILEIFDLSKIRDKNSMPHFNIKLKVTNHTLLKNNIGGIPSINSIQFVSNGGDDYNAFQILTTWQDCSVEFYETEIVSLALENKKEIKIGTLEWIRFEALASISAVEIIDLPLSDDQARIETEFRIQNKPIWKSFLLRVSNQLEQLQQSFVVFSNRFTESLTLFSSAKSGSFLTAIQHLFGHDLKRNKRQRAANVLIKQNYKKISLKRDYFNLKKLIVVTTLPGLIYGLNSDGGDVIWSLYLGVDAIPFETELGKPKIPIFIQRGTMLFQFQSQAAAIVNLKHSKKTKLISFNPITGTLLNTVSFDELKRVELLPFANSESINLLILINKKQQIKFYPEIDKNFRLNFPLYLTTFNNNSAEIKGFFVKFNEQTKPRLIEIWQSQLGFLSNNEKIIHVLAKPINQKVHSQGRVLGNRSVLYKYANPNLIAIATINVKHSSLGIWLLDGITGQIVYSGRHPHSSEPINLVHCENWIVYTYWNDKARRTELGIIELYEGLEQTNKKNFNSYTSLKYPLNVFTQSYVFSQGINAIAASETEQGLSTRSLIIAMPFGGVLEISRRFVDARRPLEPTTDLREEIEIPYMPELPIATEDLINYNQTIYNVHGIKTCASGLESTSLVFVYGLDLFYTRVTPSGTFDILKDDFDYLLISLVMIILIVTSFLSKRLWRYNSLKQAWS